MGMFLSRFPPVWKERFIRNGAPRHIADYIEKAYEDRTLSEYVVMAMREMGGEGPAMAMAETRRTTRRSSRSGCSITCRASTISTGNSMI